MPRPLHSDLARARDDARARENLQRVKNAKRAEVAGMRDITKSVQGSPAMLGDRTNGAYARKSRKLTDKLESHVTDRAYVVGDTTVRQGERIVEIRRSPSRFIVRDDDGTANVSDTLALISRWKLNRASNQEGGQ